MFLQFWLETSFRLQTENFRFQASLQHNLLLPKNSVICAWPLTVLLQVIVCLILLFPASVVWSRVVLFLVMRRFQLGTVYDVRASRSRNVGVGYSGGVRWFFFNTRFTVKWVKFMTETLIATDIQFTICWTLSEDKF